MRKMILFLLILLSLAMAAGVRAAEACGNTVTFFPEPSHEWTFTVEKPDYIICRVEFYDPDLRQFKTYSPGDGEYSLSWIGAQTVTIRTERNPVLAKIYHGVPPLRTWLPIIN